MNIDKDGNVYTASIDGSVRKLDSNGNEIWSFTGHSSIYLNDVNVDENGNVYSSNGDEIIKISSEGNEIWNRAYSSDIVYVDSDGNVYYGNNPNIVKLDTLGDEVWTYSGHTDWVYGLYADNGGNVYSASSDMTARKLDSMGNEIWVYNDLTVEADSVTADSNGYVYVGTRNGSIYKLDSNYNYMWDTSISTTEVNDVAVTPEQTLTTPTATISNTSTTADSLTFDYDISDPDGALITDGASYTVDGQTTTLSSLTGTETVTGLLSDNTYTIDLNLSYDTGDGTGTQTDTVTETVTTTALSPPTVSITNLVTTTDSFTFDYTITDPDSTIVTDGIQYTFEGVTSTLTGLTGTVSEDTLLSDTSYPVTLDVTYDLNDGTGTKVASATDTAITDSLTPPTINITNVVTSVGSFTFNYAISDPDNTLLTNGAQYTVNGASEPFPDTSGTIEVSGLEMDTEYTLETSLDYDLNDGSGTLTSSGTQTVATDPPAIPTSVVVALRIIPIVYALGLVSTAVASLKLIEFKNNTSKTLYLIIYLILGFALLPVLYSVMESAWT